VPDRKWRERPLAVVVLMLPADENTPHLLKQHLATEFPKFWIPDRFVFVDEIPKTSVGKSDKRAILAQVESQNLLEKGQMFAPTPKK